MPKDYGLCKCDFNHTLNLCNFYAKYMRKFVGYVNLVLFMLGTYVITMQ